MLYVHVAYVVTISEQKVKSIAKLYLHVSTATLLSVSHESR